MKGYFAYVVLALLLCLTCFSCSVPTVRPLGNVNFGWQSRFSPDSPYVFFEERFGGCGWVFQDTPDSTADFSGYDHVIVICDSVDAAITKMSVGVKYADTEEVSWALSPVVNGRVIINTSLLPDYTDRVRSIHLMSNRRGGARIVQASLRTPVHYRAPVRLNIENGYISADQFKGFSDSARVEFNFFVDGDNLDFVDENGDSLSILYWSTGVICSYADILGGDLPPRYIPMSGLGNQTYSCYVGDLRYMFSLTDEDGMCGLYWNIWRLGDIRSARIISAYVSEPRPKYPTN